MNIEEVFSANAYLSLLVANYLVKKGWFHSLAGSSRNLTDSVPWITYPAAAMLSRIVRPDFRVFEFGSGASTLWWNKNVQTVVSVDHNPKWIEKLKAEAPQADIRHRGINCPVDSGHAAILEEFFQKNYRLPLSGAAQHNNEHGLTSREFMGYAAELLTYPRGYFDVIVVDGMARVLTAWLAARQIKPNGIILFDNTERWQYNAAYQFLTDAGFAKLDFWGIGPVQCYEWCTSFFVRNVDLLKQRPLITEGQIADLGW
jgi:predicted O-methyltransferase YrrM